MKTHAAIFALLCAPIIANAQIAITEVMYDLPGSDSGREWVEIHNTSGAAVDLADWRFFEQDTNHRFQNEGDTTLAAGSRAIIADDVQAFQNDHPDVNALILDSAFSLKNTGEYIALKNADEEIVDETTYAPQEDADGEGASLQLIDGTWGAYAPTPGEENAASTIDNNSQGTAETQNNKENAESTETDQTTTDHTTETETNSTRPVPPDIYAFGGEDRTVIVGADATFNGRALGIKKEPLKNAQYIWNFGDGTTKEGQTVTHHFRYPGTYIVVLTVVSGELATTDHVRVVAEPSQIEITNVTNADGKSRIVLANKSTRDIHVGTWFLQTNGNTFRFPEHTFIARGQTLTLPAETTGLTPAATDAVHLLYPNTNAAFTYSADTKEQTKDNQTRAETQKDNEPQTNSANLAQSTAASQSAHTQRASSQQHTRTNAPPADNSQTINENPAPTGAGSTTTATSTQSAIVIETQSEGGSTQWLLGVIALVLLAVGGLVYIRYKELHGAHVADPDAAREARNYEIIEEDDVR